MPYNVDMKKSAARLKQAPHPHRKPTAERTKVISGRLKLSKVQELKELYPVEMTESEIINDLIREKLARAKFDKWIATMQENFNLKDIDLESLR